MVLESYLLSLGDMQRHPWQDAEGNRREIFDLLSAWTSINNPNLRRTLGSHARRVPRMAQEARKPERHCKIIGVPMPRYIPLVKFKIGAFKR